MKKIQVVIEDKYGEKEIFWKNEEDITLSPYEIIKYAQMFGLRSVKFNFGVPLKNELKRSDPWQNDN